MVCGSPPRAPPTSPHSLCFGPPPERLLTSLPLPVHRNGETPLSLLSTDGRLALLPLEHAVKVFPLSLQLSEFEEPPVLPLLPNISGVQRQHSHACWHRTQTISGSHSSCPRQRPMNPNHPSTTFDQLAEQHTFLLADLEVGLPQHENTISALRQQFEAHTL